MLYSFTTMMTDGTSWSKHTKDYPSRASAAEAAGEWLLTCMENGFDPAVRLIEVSEEEKTQ